MVYTRHQVAGLLEAGITAASLTGYKVIPDPRAVGEPAPTTKCILTIVRRVIKPSPENPRGQFAEELELWVIDPIVSDLREDELDDMLLEVIDILDASPVLGWTDATRSIHKSERNAYKITLAIYSEKDTI